MKEYWFSYRGLLLLVALLIIGTTIIYTEFVAERLVILQKLNSEKLIEKEMASLEHKEKKIYSLMQQISAENDNMPIIQADNNGNFVFEADTPYYYNVPGLQNDLPFDVLDTNMLKAKLKSFQKLNKPIQLDDGKGTIRYFYFGSTKLYRTIAIFPYLVAIFLIFFIFLISLIVSYNYKYRNNLLWVGMAKETAHQLGTPISSMKGWVEVLQEDPEQLLNILPKLKLDIDRLGLVTDRFGKIGITPKLEATNIDQQINTLVHYIQERVSKKINITVVNAISKNVTIDLAQSLFDWTLENLIKNAIDAMEGRPGNIIIQIKNTAKQKKIIIDIIDSGKGIKKKDQAKIFLPGYTSKRRGWGMGLALAKRVIENFHHGKILLLRSELFKGTTIRIILNKRTSV
ncbi:MAG: HAMP domain-containing sensor histidine kinase [Phycisphaerales bacterium]|nr:HAMP domain-containing sensor histidine kinase [Phycisphaerales bacterium]